MSKDNPMLHEKTEDLLLQKCKQRHNEFGQYRYWSPRTIPGIRYRETTAYEKIDDALKAQGWQDIAIGDEWAGDGQFAWFRLQFAVPKEFDGKTLVAILKFGQGGWNGGEGCLFIDGVPYQGIDANHTDVVLAKKAKAGQRYDLVVECVSTPVWQNQRHKIKLEQADIAALNYDVQDYWYDLGFMTNIAEHLPWGNRRRATIIRTANKSVDAFDFEAAGFDGLASTAKNARKIIAPLYKKPADASAMEFACGGHSHIDVAWLWPYAESVRKCSRTFSTVDRLMDEYPDYLFTQSQAQLYEFTQEHYPDLYERIKKRVKERRFEPQGSMWVEADCNVTSGESLVRQILLGKTLFMDEFGIETDILWLPDVFGYSAALPQILKKSGVDYFTTIKISWSQFNKFPYSSFWWEGIDGTRVLAHFPPSNDYNARINANQLLPAAENYREKDRSDIALYSYGYGDGGGGPTREHLEHLKRARDLEGIPKCTPMWAADFFKQLVKRSEDLPSWVGELYLEYHRGTYTTQSRNKRANRKSELLLRDAEMAAGLAWMTKGLKYPHDSITRAWKLVCKNQFHDVIPGTSVTDVYKDTALDYKEIAGIGAAARTAGLDKLASPVGEAFNGLPHGRVSVGEAFNGLPPEGLGVADGRPLKASPTGAPSDGQTIMLFNSLSWDRIDPAKVSLPGKASGWHVETHDGEPVPSQASKKDPSVLWFEPQVPGIGIGALKLVKGAGKAVSEIKVSESGIENSFYKIKLDKSGLITSILDKRSKREVLPQGEKANKLQLFEDKPISWDAWDIEFYYRDKGRDLTDVPVGEAFNGLPSSGGIDARASGRPLKASPTEIKVEDAGPVRGSLKIRRKFGSSEIEQRIVLWAASPRIDFETRVDWHETKKMLKVAFPVDVHASHARFDIQFGSVDRPTHWNTSWDFARLEVAAQKWVDMSQADHGVSLLNDCKYGHDVHENVMRLTLLRSPKEPDPTADMGEHFFTYSLLPHEGDWRDSETVRRAYELNVPTVAWLSDVTPPSPPATEGSGEGSGARVGASGSKGQASARGKLPSVAGGLGGVTGNRLLSVDAPNVIIETVKKAEKEDALVVRMYECAGMDAAFRLEAGFKVAHAVECDLLERDLAALKLEGNCLPLSMKPFEIKTVKLRA